MSETPLLEQLLLGEDVLPKTLRAAEGALRAETPLHRAADAHLAKLSVAVRYAFAMGRRALGKDANVGAAVAAIHAALLEVLPPALLACLADCGAAAVGMLKKQLRAAGDVEGHPFHGNQWTSEGGASGVVFHGTARKNLDSILSNGIEASGGDAARASFAHSGKAVFVTTELNEAKAYAVDHAEVPNGVVLEVHVPAGEVFNKSYGKSILYREQAIPASWIKGVHARVDKTGRVFKGGGRVKYSQMGLTWKKIRSLSGVDGQVIFIVVDLGEDEELRSLKPSIIKPTIVAPLKMRFDASSEAAAAWAREHAAELAKNLSDTSEQAIRDAVARGSEEGDLGAVYDDVLAAVGDADRAQLIARTEVMTAANEGQRQAWDQAVDEGLLSGDERVAWIATGDACPECEALDGEERDLDGVYPDDGGDGPPLHPNCRCTEGII